MARYVGRRRSGIRGRLGLLRGAVDDRETGETVLYTRSPRLASVIARLLNGERVHRRRVESRSPVHRYGSGGDGTSTRRIVYAAASSGRAGFGDGVVAVTEDRDLADRVSAMLNEIDPEPRPRVTRFGWW